jgi:cytochrome c oxidase subunit 2
MSTARADPSAMPLGVHIMEHSASTMAPHIDLVFTAMLVLCGLVALGVCAMVLFFSLRYHESRKHVDRSRPPTRKLALELTWTLTPTLIFIAIYAWASRYYVELYEPPAGAMPIYVVAKQWMWKLQHRNGKREINELHLPLGRPVRLIMTSQDAIHSFFVPAFRVKQDVLPGRYTSLWFTPTRLGEYHLFCAEYCGSEHALMEGRIVVMTPAAFGRWLAQGSAQPSMAEYGYTLFREHGCSGCHGANATVHAPLLDGLIGRTVHLQDGRSLVADDNYVRDSILTPNKDVVAGFDPVMPSFAGQLSEEDIEALIAYLRSTGSGGPKGVTP